MTGGKHGTGHGWLPGYVETVYNEGPYLDLVHADDKRLRPRAVQGLLGATERVHHRPRGVWGTEPDAIAPRMRNTGLTGLSDLVERRS